MWRFRLSTITIILFSLAGAAFAQVSSTGVISQTVAERYGLKRAWYTQIDLDRSRSRVAFVSQFVDFSKVIEVHEIAHEEGIISITAKDIDEYGDPLGAEEAQKLAISIRRKFTDAGKKAGMVSRQIPEVTLYVQTTSGTLQSIDATTGKTNWAANVGSPKRLILPAAANSTHVATTNGSKLYVLDKETGKVTWERSLGAAPGAGPAVSQDLVYVPLVNGYLETYKLQLKQRARQTSERKNILRGDPPKIYHSAGFMLVQPTVTPNTVSWTTDRGYLYVAHANFRGLHFKLDCNDAIVAPAAYQRNPNRLFVGSTDGYVYCADELKGDLVWDFSTGSPVVRQPIVVGSSLYSISDDGSMFKISALDGSEIWRSYGIDRFVAASGRRLYCLEKTGRLALIDAKTGGRIASIPMPGLDLWITNPYTDRIFVGTKMGTLQCLHESELAFPLVHINPESEKRVRDAVKQGGGETAVDPPPVGPGDDPFGGGAAPAPGGDDPFGGGAAPAPGGDDPFGGGAAPGGDDPFGGGAAPAPAPSGDDPFGDPFGG